MVRHLVVMVIPLAVSHCWMVQLLSLFLVDTKQGYLLANHVSSNGVSPCMTIVILKDPDIAISV